MRKKPEPKIFEVLSTSQVTPNMRRVTVGGEVMKTFPSGQEGGYVKLALKGYDESARPKIRTYTIIAQRPDALDIDFALHGAEGEGGPAVKWSMTTKPGDTISMGGPGAAKPLPSGADWYFVLGDMTALPAITVNLAALPENAKGCAVIEIQSEDDKQDLKRPAGVDIEWVINPEPGCHPELMETAVRAIEWPTENVYAWSASEFEVMRRLRTYLREEKGLGKDQLYISSYWKHGLVEDDHKVVKREDSLG
jgi:NADPH-dependent ferric siderophore reductase